MWSSLPLWNFWPGFIVEGEGGREREGGRGREREGRRGGREREREGEEGGRERERLSTSYICCLDLDSLKYQSEEGDHIFNKQFLMPLIISQHYL